MNSFYMLRCGVKVESDKSLKKESDRELTAFKGICHSVAQDAAPICGYGRVRECSAKKAHTIFL